MRAARLKCHLGIGKNLQFRVSRWQINLKVADAARRNEMEFELIYKKVRNDNEYLFQRYLTNKNKKVLIDKGTSVVTSHKISVKGIPLCIILPDYFVNWSPRILFQNKAEILISDRYISETAKDLNIPVCEHTDSLTYQMMKVSKYFTTTKQTLDLIN